jgi:hypothetical protein
MRTFCDARFDYAGNGENCSTQFFTRVMQARRTGCYVGLSALNSRLFRFQGVALRWDNGALSALGFAGVTAMLLTWASCACRGFDFCTDHWGLHQFLRMT